MSTLTQWLADFHFIRPWWLLALIPAALLPWWLQRLPSARSQWQQVVDPHLQAVILEQTVASTDERYQQRRRGLTLAAIAIAIALAGPSWERLPQPVFRNQDSLVILLDQSYSMAAEDVSPSRNARALQKITDILKARRDGQTALVVYAGDAHTVTPLTDDSRTIINLLPALTPYIMPSPGSRPDLAIELAQKLVTDAGIPKARLLLITDGVQEKDADRINEQLDRDHFELSILGIGSQDGAPIPLPKGGFLQDSSGDIVMARLDTRVLDQVAQETGARWRPLSLLDDDWQSLITTRPDLADGEPAQDDQRQIDQWQDRGYLLAWLLLPVVLLAFRRGAVFCLILIPLLHPQPAAAFGWQDLWQTPDQQGAQLLAEDPAAAASRFEDPAWKGTAAYQANDFAGAASAFERSGTADGYYNQGNALTRAGKLPEALAAYDKALQLNPGMDDAAYNRKLVEDALKQQQNGQNQNDQNQNDQNQNGQNQNGQNQNDQNQNSQNQNSQNQNGQNQNGQNQNGQNQNGQNQNGQNQNGQNQSGQDQNGQDQNGQDQSVQSQQTPDGQNADGQSPADQDQNQQRQGMAQDQSQDAGQETNGQPLATQADGQPALDAEQQARLQQWLNRVPDQPGKLLERKFLYQYSQKKQPTSSEDVLW